MPIDGWETMALGEFLTLQRGHDLPTQERKPGQVPIIGSAGLTGYHDASRARGPGVTVGRSGASIGVVTYVAQDYWPLNTALYVRDFHSNDERFAYYLLRSMDFAHLNSGSAQPSLNRNFVHRLPVVVPKLAEQGAISGVLGSLDDKIQVNELVTLLLRAIARADFVRRFVDFDEAVELVDTPVGTIPEGWKVGVLGDLATRLVRSANPANMGETLFEHFSIPSFDANRLPEIVSGRQILSAKTLLTQNAVLVSKLNPTTRRVWDARPRCASAVAVCSGEFVALIAKRDLARCFLQGVVEFDDVVWNHLLAHATGTTGSRQRVRPADLLNAPVVLPTDDALRAYDVAASPIFDRLHELILETKALAELRDALLPRLISGEVRVPKAMVEEVSGVIVGQEATS